MKMLGESEQKAKIAAAMLTAATVIGGAFPAAAQQMASAQPDFSNCDRMHQTNPKGAIQCRVDVLKAHTAALGQESGVLRQETAQLERDGQCARDLKALRTRDPAIVDRGRAILAGRPLAEYGVCNLLSALTRG